MQIDWGAWATSHFNPDLDIQVLGSHEVAPSVSEIESQFPEREVLGVWLGRRPGLGAFVIYEEDGIIRIEEQFVDKYFVWNNTRPLNGS